MFIRYYFENSKSFHGKTDVNLKKNKEFPKSKETAWKFPCVFKEFPIRNSKGMHKELAKGTSKEFQNKIDKRPTNISEKSPKGITWWISNGTWQVNYWNNLQSMSLWWCCFCCCWWWWCFHLEYVIVDRLSVYPNR